MRFKESLLFIVLIAGTLYNLDNSIARLFSILIWACLPFIILLLSIREKVSTIIIIEIKYALFIIFLLLCSFLINMDTLSFGIAGSEVEKMTPFLYISFVIIFLVFLQLDTRPINPKFITYFFLLVLFILLLDMIVRYIQSPSLFLNNSHRQSAKNLGFFNNTNIVGQIIAFLLILSWQIKFQFKKIVQIVLSFILFSTMARSAIASVIIIFMISFLLKDSGLIKRIFSFLIFFLLVLVIFIDPMNFQNDGSLLSKISFFESSYNIILDGNLINFLFGYASSLKEVTLLLNVDGHSPHIALIKAFLYYGLVGICIFFFILIHFIKLHKNMFYPVSVYFLFSLAGAPIFWPTLSVGLIILMIYDNIERNNLNVSKQCK